MTLKQKIYNHYKQLVDDNIILLQQVMADLKESSDNESRSTAGDKHETALAMLQIEQANIRGQLQNVLEKKAALEKINPALSASEVVNGSLIKTNYGYLFMSVALVKITIEGTTVTALSPLSPLGKKLKGLKVSEGTEINNNNYIIESIE